MKSVYMGNPPDVKRVYACAEALLKAEANCAGYLTREDVLTGRDTTRLPWMKMEMTSWSTTRGRRQKLTEIRCTIRIVMRCL